jgi:hypothetical protein
MLGDTTKPELKVNIDLTKKIIPNEKSKDTILEAEDTSDLPEPPVVVYVKEVGKAGI